MPTHAVIATDTGGNVVFINPVAQQLTGWLSEDARGRPLSQVFRIIDEETREPVTNLVERALGEGQAVGLTTPTLLLSRDGTETPIDDSMARSSAMLTGFCR